MNTGYRGVFIVVEQKNYNNVNFFHNVFQIRQRIKYFKHEKRKSVRCKPENEFPMDKNYIG